MGVRARARARRTAALALALALAWTVAAAPARALPSFDEVRTAHRPSDIPLLDRRGEVIQWHRVDPGTRRGPWLSLADMSPALREAIVLSEDRRFWAHGGVDWRALAASAWGNAWNTRTRGASTVTMQLAGLLDEELARPAGGRDVPTKVGQILRAQQLEARWSKTQILEAYLNTVPLRGELVGVAAASQQLFGKHASGLDAQEAAVLAVLVRAPNAGADAVSRRACEVLRRPDPSRPQQQPHRTTLVHPPTATASLANAEPRTGPGTDPCTGVATTVAQALARRPGPMLGESLAPHLARLMARLMARPKAGAGRAAAAPQTSASMPWPGSAPGQPPLELRSTLDAQVQRVARSALRRQLAELRGRAVEDGAIIVLDNASGEVLAWVGSAGSGASAAAEVDAVLARRQPGSTIKPFVYALALERRLVTAASLIDDSPLQLSAGAAGLYTPQNYDHAYRGGVSVREALASSLNVPAVRVAAMLEPEVLFERLNAAGLRLAHNAGHHGHALALGSADVTLLDLTNAYRMLAQGGQLTPVRWWAATAPTATRQVFSPEAAWLVSHILADPAARAASFGLDSPLVTRGHAAVKTGTSKDMRDNWCVGSTERYTVGVWVGNASGRPMHGVSGVSGAAPVWRELVMHLHTHLHTHLHAHTHPQTHPQTHPHTLPAALSQARSVASSHGQPAAPSRPPTPPPGLVAAAGEWFIMGTEPTPAHAAAAGRAMPFGIEAPRAGTVIALDPDIPLAAQRVVLRGARGQWWLDGQLLGQGTRLEWLPRPGRHVLERRDAAAPAIVDRVDFEVRATSALAQAQTQAPSRALSRAGRTVGWAGAAAPPGRGPATPSRD